MKEAIPAKSFTIQLSMLNKREELPVTNCTQRSFNFPEVKKRVVEVNFAGGDITSDGGVMLLRQVDRQIGLSKAVASVLEDTRRQATVASTMD
ncbi:MAG: transposase [Nitrosomonas halophila]